MLKIIFEALKLAPRFLWQLYIQPSKIYDFYHADRKNVFVLTWGFFFSGLLMGTALAIPHYFFYHDLLQSFIFVFLVAFVFAVSFSFSVSFSLAVAIAIAVAVAVAFTYAFELDSESAVLVVEAFAVIFAFAFAGAVVGAVSFVFVGSGTISSVIAGSIVGAVAIAGVFFTVLFVAREVLNILKKYSITFFYQSNAKVALSLLFISCIVFFYLIFKGGKKTKDKYAPVIFACASVFLVLMITPLEMELLPSPVELLYHFSFLAGYMFYLFFLNGIRRRIFSKIGSEPTDKSIEFLLKYRKLQITSLSWGPIIWIIVYSLRNLVDKKIPDSLLEIVTLGFIFISLFASHVPDYLICLPLWAKQRRQILGNSDNKAGMLLSYEKSVLFKHEQLFFPLPGLDKLMLYFAYHNEFGLNEAARFIMNLYQYTFQHRQAEKAVLELATNKEMTHPLFLALLASDGIPVIEKMSSDHPFASLYYALTDIKNSKRLPETMRNHFFVSSITKPPEDKNLSWLYRKDLFRQASEIDQKFTLKPLEERIDIVCKLMSVEKGYRYNEEMIKTLTASRQLMIAKNLQDVSGGIEILQGIHEFPIDIKYFSFIAAVMPRLKKVKESLLQIDAIERVGTRRSILQDQRQEMASIQAKIEQDLFEPFNRIWGEGFKRCQEILDQGTNILQGSAVLAIQLKNHEIPASVGEHRLYFEITNKGQELASQVTVSIEEGSPGLVFPAGMEIAMAVIESGAVKEIFFAVRAGQPMETRVKGTLTFTDRTASDKRLPFSFPVRVRQRRAEFKKIENPYIIGQPLKGETPLFYGREDAHRYIDENILASGDHHTFVCYGLRRSGKTSLLYRIESQGFTDPRLRPVYVDMQGVDDERDFYATLAGAITEKLSLPATAAVENFSGFKQFLQEINPGLGERIIVLMVDEFEELQMRVEDGRVSRTIFSNIRHLMQHEEKLIFLFCGTHKIEEMAADYWSIFFNTAVYYRLTRLKEEDVVRLIKEPVKDRLNYDDLAVGQILKMTGGQPYLIQLVCRTLVNALNETKKRNDAMIDDVDDAVDSIIKGGTDHFSQQIWTDATTFERVVMSAIAEELTHTQAEHIGVEGIYAKIRTVSSAYSRKEMMETLGKLVSREILSEKNMVYRFPVEMLRKWLAARYPLRKVREEI